VTFNWFSVIADQRDIPLLLKILRKRKD